MFFIGLIILCQNNNHIDLVHNDELSKDATPAGKNLNIDELHD